MSHDDQQENNSVFSRDGMLATFYWSPHWVYLMRCGVCDGRFSRGQVGSNSSVLSCPVVIINIYQYRPPGTHPDLRRGEVTTSPDTSGQQDNIGLSSLSLFSGRTPASVKATWGRHDTAQEFNKELCSVHWLLSTVIKWPTSAVLLTLSPSYVIHQTVFF